MSIHHRSDLSEISDTTLYELYSLLGERDTPALFNEPYTLDTKHDWPTGAGNTVDRKIVGIDRTLYAQVMDGEFKATGLGPQQIINAWCEHERSEICIIQGDNAVDTYLPAHNRALRREHEFYKAMGADPKKVEAIIWPALVACYNRPVRKPHPLKWCGPILDNAGPRDQEILIELQKHGVKDAFKKSKYPSHYGFGDHQCMDCLHLQFGGVTGPISPCEIISGMVRDDRHCDYWADRPVAAMAKLPDEEKLSHESACYGHARGGELRCGFCRYSDHAVTPRCAHVVDIKPTGWCRLWDRKL